MSEDLRSGIAEPVIEVRQLRRRYGGQRSLLGRSGPGSRDRASKAKQSFEAVRGVDLQVGRGELFALLGANGAGKTSKLRRGLSLARAEALLPVRNRTALFPALLIPLMLTAIVAVLPDSPTKAPLVLGTMGPC